MLLQNKNILITGASSGIGRQTAISCSRQGANLLIIGRNADRLQETFKQLQPGNHISMTLDITDYALTENILKPALLEFGKLHGVVNAAGISTTLPLKMLSPSTMTTFFEANVNAAINLTRICVSRKTIADEGASILFFSSVMGLVGEAGKTMYSATKGALISASRSLAIELAPRKIRVNAISPGVVVTPMTDNAVYSQDEASRQKIIDLHPLGLGTPDDIAAVCIFLLSDASRWITGTNLVVDGGYTAR